MKFVFAFKIVNDSSWVRFFHEIATYFYFLDIQRLDLFFFVIFDRCLIYEAFVQSSQDDIWNDLRSNYKIK